MTRILFLPGNGHEYYADVAYIADFPRAENGQCAFCLGNPVPDVEKLVGKEFFGEFDYLKATNIELYALEEHKTFETCPFCLGRPS